jgi:hypothetical protein
MINGKVVPQLPKLYSFFENIGEVVSLFFLLSFSILIASLLSFISLRESYYSLWFLTAVLLQGVFLCNIFKEIASNPFSYFFMQQGKEKDMVRRREAEKVSLILLMISFALLCKTEEDVHVPLTLFFFVVVLCNVACFYVFLEYKRSTKNSITRE